MRQAGRYLPEYRKLRSSFPGFLDFCYTPEAASEATIQPIRRFGMDGAIIFSDILVIPKALGMNVRFEEGRGPVLEPLKDPGELDAGGLEEKLSPVYEALQQTRSKLPDETALIGFAGAPWTLACYMIEGGSSRDFAHAKARARQNPAMFSGLLDLLSDSIARHLIAQAEAGAEVLQLFDSWAGLLDNTEYAEWTIAPAQRIVRQVKTRFPDIPMIGFPRQSGIKYLEYALKTGVDAVSFDDSVPLEWVKENLQPKVVVQGCLTPSLLADNLPLALEEAGKILAALGDKAFVFNLGHGILPHTPVEHMQALCEFLRKS